MNAYIPAIVQVAPQTDYTVYVYFEDGKVVCYDVKPFLQNGVFTQIEDINVFIDRCTIMNDTLAWDVSGNGDPASCIDIDPETLYYLPHTGERIHYDSPVVNLSAAE